jgi:probable phosphoglycerate mutase
MILYVVRHGETQWNRLCKVQGIADIPLAEEGIRLAQLTGEALKDVPFDICYTSPLIRAKQTAQYILGDRQIPLIEDDRIMEIDFGELEGSTILDEDGKIPDRRIELFIKDPLAYPRPEGGEDIQDILKRTGEFWEEITTDPALADKTVLVSSHGCAVRALLQNVYQDSADFWHGHVPPNCSVNILEIQDGKARFLEEDRVYA